MKYTLLILLVVKTALLLGQNTITTCDSIKLKDGQLIKGQIVDKTERKITYIMCCENCAVPREIKRKNIDTIFFAEPETIFFAEPETKKFAQNNVRPLNSIQINLLGDASIISINYDKQFLISSTFILSGKLGLGFNQEFILCLGGGPCSPPKTYMTIPHHITGNIGKGRHFFEFGLGGTVISGNANQNYLLYPIVGFRMLPLNSNKLNFRIFGQIPFSGLGTVDNILFIPFGLSLGISF